MRAEKIVEARGASMGVGRGGGALFVGLVFGLGAATRPSIPEAAFHVDGGPMRPASRIEAKVPGSIDLLVGQRRRFGGVSAASVVDPEIARVSVDGGLLTVRGVQAGNTKMLLFLAVRPGPSASASPVPVAVIVRQP